MVEQIAVLGAGSWGTTLAVHLARKEKRVRLWEVSPELARRLDEKRENIQFLPSVPIPRSVMISSCLDEVTEGADLLVVAVPSQTVREVMGKLGTVSSGTVLVSGVKGLEEGTQLRMSEVIEAELGACRLVVLSGPSHAEEVSRGIPTTVVLASRDEEAVFVAQECFNTVAFRAYRNSDIVGVELGGALKNVIAIAAGMCDGLGLGDNTKAALLTRGLAEITRLGAAMGARRRTFAGLSGMGDLITTCISKYSRNRSLGQAIAEGRALEVALRELGQVAEGVRTTYCACQLAKRYQVEVPITREVSQVIFAHKEPREAVKDLMLRPPKAEVEEESV